MKFLIEDAQALTIMEWARKHLEPDPHSDPDFGDGYHVNSVYLDTPRFDVFHRVEGFQRQKFRLRRYGRESLIYFEQKKKRKGLVRKRRVSVLETDVSSRLLLPANEEWDGHWFRSKVDEQELWPVCRITYQRFARVMTNGEGPVRLTIDDRLTADVSDGWKVPVGELDGVPLLNGQRILEMKFRGAMPVLFRSLIEQQQISLTSFSKYRVGVEKCVSIDSLARDEKRGSDNA